MRNTLSALFKSGSLRGDTAQIYAYQFVTLGISLIGGVIVARTLGPAEKGIFDLFNLINSFIVELGLLGFGSGILYYLANKGVPLKEVHGTGLLFTICIGLLTAILGWIGLPLWRNIFPGLKDWIILLAFTLAPVAYYRYIWSNIMTGINRAVATFKISLFITIVNLLAILILFRFEHLAVSQLIILTASLAVVNAAVAFGLLYKRETDLKPRLSLMRDGLRYGLIIYVGFIANVLHFKIDQVMINYWLGSRAVGLYAVSVNWAEMLFILDSAVTSAALYKISASSPEESYKLTVKLFKVQLLISSVSGIILAGLSYPMILIIYGEAFREAIWPLILIIPGIVAWSVSKIVSNMLIYNRGLAGFVVKAAVSGMLLNIMLNYLLIKMSGLGIIGASIASSASYLFVALIIYFKSRREGICI